MRVHQDDGSQPATIAAVPSTALFCTPQGTPTTLSGPRVRIAVDGDIQTAQQRIPVLSDIPVIGALTTTNITEPSRVAPVTAEADGCFVRPDIDTAQTTAFYATHQTITLAERAARRAIPWGDDGQLTVRPNAFVGTSSLELNAFFMGATREVQLGSLGSVRDGRLVPLDGSSIGFLEHALAVREQAVRDTYALLTARGIAPDSAPASLREARAQITALRGIIDAARRDDVAETQRLIAAERNRPSEQQGTPSPGNLADGFMRMFGGRREAASEALPVDTLLSTGQSLRYGGDLIRASFEIGRVRPLPGRLVRLAQDRFVASHEAGHAALSTLMPSLTASSAGRAFHEAYGDTIAVLTAFDSAEVTRAVLAETRGELTRSNSVSRIAEELARTVATATRDTADDGDVALRDAANPLGVRDISGLDAAAQGVPSVPDGSRADQPHHVSQIISGALYAHFATEASEAARHARDPIAAVQGVRDVSANTLHAAMLFMPESGGSLHDIGAALLRGARETESTESVARFEQILRDRGLLAADPTPRITRDLPVASLNDLDAARRNEGPLAAHVGRWTGNGDVREIERTTDGYGYTRVRFGDASSVVVQVAGSLVFDRDGRLVAASDGSMEVKPRSRVCAHCRSSGQH